MDAMTICQRCRRAPQEIAEIEDRIQQRRDALTTLSAAMGREGSQGPARDRMAETAAAIADMEKTLTGRKNRQAVELVAVSALSEALEPPMSRVIYLYYGKCLTARAVAKRMKYTEGYIRQLRRQATDRLRAISGDQLLDYVPAWYLEEMEET